MLKIVISFLLSFLCTFHSAEALLSSAPTEDQSSITDTQKYRKFCNLAATDDALFRSFKQHPILVKVMQHISYMQGKEYFLAISKTYPHLLSMMHVFRENDTIGNPTRYKYGEFGRFSPTNLRYIHIAGHIEKIMGNLTGQKVIEIGGGYGGQCKVLSDLFTFETYTLVDLPEPLALAKRCLDKLGTPHVHYLTQEQLGPDETYNLVISNYAFSECSRSIQEEYLEKVIAKSRAGYLICNQLDFFSDPKPLGKRELVRRLKGYGFAVDVRLEVPRSSEKNYLITWSSVSDVSI